MKIFNFLCMALIGASAASYARNNRGQQSNTLRANNLRFNTSNLQQFNSKRNGKLEMAGLLSQLTGNTLNQIGRATGNKNLQIAGFATNQMGVNASAINSFRQKDGSFSTDSKKKQKNNPNQNPNNLGKQNQKGSGGKNWGQNNFQPPINAPRPGQQNAWQNQNQGPKNQNVDLLDVNFPAQNTNSQQNINLLDVNFPVQNANPPAPVQNPGVNGGLNNPTLNQPMQNVEQAKENNQKDKNLIDFD